MSLRSDVFDPVSEVGEPLGGDGYYIYTINILDYQQYSPSVRLTSLHETTTVKDGDGNIITDNFTMSNATVMGVDIGEAGNMRVVSTITTDLCCLIGNASRTKLFGYYKDSGVTDLTELFELIPGLANNLYTSGRLQSPALRGAAHL
jgi:hypothetical protein